MSLLPKGAWISILAAAALSPASPQAAAQTARVQRVALLKSSPSTEIEIQTSRRLIPLTQVLTDPDRLVIDFSGAVPSPEIRTITVNNSGVKEVRVGSVTDNPDVLEHFSTDGSIFQASPAGVVYPANTADVRKTVQYVAERAAAGKDYSLVPRGKGSGRAKTGQGGRVRNDDGRVTGHREEAVLPA